MKLYDPEDEYLAKLSLELSNAAALAGDFQDIVQRVERIWEDPDRELVIEGLYEFAEQTVDPKSSMWYPKPVYTLSAQNESLLYDSLRKLVASAEHLPSRDRQTVDRTVSRLIRLLSHEKAFRVVEPWFNDPRKFRQSVVHRAIRNSGVPDSYAPLIVEWYRETHSDEAIKIISENQNCAQLLRHDDIEMRLKSPDRTYSIGQYLVVDRESTYWKMRAVSAYLSTGRTISDQIANEHPREFLWAVGRSKSLVSLPQVTQLLMRFTDDAEFIWRIWKTMQIVGTPDDLALVRSFADQIVVAGSEQ